MLRNLQLSTLSENPIAGSRSLVVSVTDDAGGSTVPVTLAATVTASNDAPVLSLPGSTVSYVENAVATLLDLSATVTDIEGNWNGGSITTTITGGGDSSDTLTIVGQGFGLNQIGVSGAFVLYGTVSGPLVIGNISGGNGGAPLTIALTANATATSISALLQRLSFSTAGDAPSTATRTINIQVSDNAAAAVRPIAR